MCIEIETLVRATSYGIICLIGWWLYKLAIRIIDNTEKNSSLILRWANWYALGTNPLPEYTSGIGQKYEEYEKPMMAKLFQNKYFQFIYCWIGLCFSYLIWGIIQERLMTKTYDILIGNSTLSIQFKDSDFVILINRIFSFAVGAVIIKLKYWYQQSHFLDNRELLHKPPFYIFGFSSLSNLISSFCQYESLKYISFPTQVIVKACKLIPVMLMNTIVSKKHYSKHQYLLAVLLCCGFGIFLYGNSLKKTNENSLKMNHVNFTLWSIFLPLGYLIFDSFTSTWQSKIFKQYDGADSILAMTYSCIISSILSLSSILANRQLSRVSLLLTKSAKFRYHIIGSGAASILGQLMVYHTIAVLGPITFTLIMITRQIMSILLSSFIYHHHITYVSYIGMAIIFGVLIGDKMYNLKKKSHH